MRRARWLAKWKDSSARPVIYHCISRVVDRRFVFGDEEREQFRMYMRMQENFTGCRVLSYCIMSNHFHILLEVPPMPEEGISDAELLKRLSAIYSDHMVATVTQELQWAAQADSPHHRQAIHDRYTYRMNDLSQFMKTMLQRFTRWFNRVHQRRGTLWEERFKSVIVEDGQAARTMAAYIDLNPVRAGMVEDPAQYRWCSYGEAIGGGVKGNGRKAREGLVRAYMAHLGVGFDIKRWEEVSRQYRQVMSVALERKPGKVAQRQVQQINVPTPVITLPELNSASMLMQRIRYFSDGAVIGSRAFVDEAFRQARERFGPKRKDGARKLEGAAEAAAGEMWSARALQVNV